MIIFFWPYLWENPITNFVTSFKNLSHHDVNIYNFYLGEHIHSKRVPWHYPIIWIFISTPLFYLSLFVIGFIFILRRLIKRILKIEENDSSNDIWRGIKEIQDLIFFSSFAVPLIYVIIFNSTLYDGWRHLYFIYPSFLMISLFGLHILKTLFFILVSEFGKWLFRNIFEIVSKLRSLDFFIFFQYFSDLSHEGFSPVHIHH